MDKPIIVDLLRHGEVSGGNRFRGSTDDALTELGWQEMFRQCDGNTWDRVISSPLSRCRSFAEVWAEQQQLNLAIDADWREIDFGDWEGKTAEQISRMQPNELALFYADPFTFMPPGGERYLDFAARIHQAWENLLSNESGSRVLLVTHAGVMRELYSFLLAIPPRQTFQIDVPHACLTRFSCFQETDNRFVQLNFHRPV
jgi:alpha-ribazole phosphatase